MINSKASPRTVCVVGLGTIGKALYGVLEPFYDVSGYDVPKRTGLEPVNKDVVIVAVPTPEVPAVVEALDETNRAVVICSTVPLGMTEYLAGSLDRPIAHVPMFCNEDTAEVDLKYRFGFLVIGSHDVDLADTVETLFAPVRPSRVLRIGPTEAEMVKLASNAFYALKVAFANELCDVAEVLEIDYAQVRQGLENCPYIFPNHLDPLHKGYRGYGGTCLPKDTQSLWLTSENEERPMRTLEAGLRWLYWE